MHALLIVLARLAGERPKAVLAAIAAITAVLGGFSTQQTTDTELTAFATDSELAAGLDRVQEEFSGGGVALQVIVDAGAQGNVLASDGRAAADQVRGAIDEALTGVDGVGAGVDAIVVRTFVDAPELRSSDADVQAGTARAGLVVAAFPPTMEEERAADLSLALADRIDQLEAPGVDVSAFNQYVLGDALQVESQKEMPRLLSLSMLLILAILVFQYRTVSDVVIGLVGLVASVIWMTGLGVLLGPGYLGVVGPFSQMAMIVPVLLVGLGIDYAIHLTSRYREEQSHGEAPASAARRSVLTVGGALVLATVTTIVGFLTNLASPLPPIADFGVFTAVGVLGAFIVMTTLVPAARNVLDGRQRAGRPTRVHRPAGGLSKVIARVSVVAERTPRLALGLALVVSLAATGAATQVGTTFSQDDFIPEGSEIGQLVDRVDVLFGGGLTETTFVLLDGDLEQAEVAAAQLELAERLAGIDGVRTSGGVAQASSPASLVASAVAADPALVDRAEELGYAGETGFAPDADVASLFELARGALPSQAAQIVAPDGGAGVIAVGTTAGQDGADALRDQLDGALAPLRDLGVATTVTSEELVLDESLDALTDSQTQGIVVTLVAALILLVTYYGFKERKAVLGVITMVPSVAVVSWVLGTMWLLDIDFNVMTAMVASLAIGIGVPFGIHVTHRFLEDRRRYDSIDEAVRQTVTHTGGAMAGSAATTAAGFGVLVLASLTPMRQFGTIVAITILYSFVAAITVQPACLKLWGDRRARRGDVATLLAHEHRGSPAPTGDRSEAQPEPVG